MPLVIFLDEDSLPVTWFILPHLCLLELVIMHLTVGSEEYE